MDTEVTHFDPELARSRVDSNASSNEKKAIGEEKTSDAKAEIQSTADDDSEDGHVLDGARDLITHVISLDDDPSLSPWTFRTLVIGTGLSTFGGVLGELYHLHVAIAY